MDFNLKQGDSIRQDKALDLNLTATQDGPHLLLIDDNKDIHIKIINTNIVLFNNAFPIL